jgi:hypothetical protein
MTSSLQEVIAKPTLDECLPGLNKYYYHMSSLQPSLMRMILISLCSVQLLEELPHTCLYLS